MREGASGGFNLHRTRGPARAAKTIHITRKSGREKHSEKLARTWGVGARESGKMLKILRID